LLFGNSQVFGSFPHMIVDKWKKSGWQLDFCFRDFHTPRMHDIRARMRTMAHWLNIEAANAGF